MPILIPDESLKESRKIESSNKSKSEIEKYNLAIQELAKKLEQSGFEMRLCPPEELPNFLLKAQKQNPTIFGNQDSWKNIYQLKIKNADADNKEKPSSIYVINNRYISDNWTKESIRHLAQFAGTQGGNWSLLPTGTPGEFPPELRQFAIDEFARNGVHLYDPTPPVEEVSKSEYQQFKPATQETQQQFKDELARLKQQEPSNEEENKIDNPHTSINPFQTKLKPRK